MINIYEEAARCLLCADAPCSKACKNGDPARALRAARFSTAALAGQGTAGGTDAELEQAEAACIHPDSPVRIKELLRSADCGGTTVSGDLPSLAVTFCGIRCENPFFLASSAVCTNYEMVARAFDMGWAGVFYKTICLQDIHEVSPRFDAVREGNSFSGFRNMEQLSENPVDMDFDILRRLKQTYPSKIVVASIMGQTDGQWVELARRAEEAGCDALELNFSCPQMREAGMGSDVGQNADLVMHYTSCVKQNVRIPVIAKMTPNITHMSNPARGACLGGADGISAINTIKSITVSPDAEVTGKLTVSGYSGRAVKPIALRYIYEMASDPETQGVPLSGIGGIETWRDALEFIQLGCSNVQVCTAVMQYGYRIIDDLILGLQRYMAKRGINELAALVGEQLPKFLKPDHLDRDTIIYPKFDRELCIGCGRCEVSCSDGGHQAIVFDRETRRPRLVGTKCVGCHLCRLVCPAGAIGTAKRIVKPASR